MRVEAELQGLKLDLVKNSHNERARELYEMKLREQEWLKGMIREGKDPGVRIV